MLGDRVLEVLFQPRRRFFRPEPSGSRRCCTTIGRGSTVGMLAGIGEFLIAVLITALILLILEARYLRVLRRLDAQSWRPKNGERGEE